MHPESGHGLRVQLATALRERDEAKANTHGWLSVVEQLRENLNATLLERDDLKEALAAARMENANLKATITAMLADLDIGGVLELDSGSMAKARAALATPAVGEEKSNG